MNAEAAFMLTATRQRGAVLGQLLVA